VKIDIPKLKFTKWIEIESIPPILGDLGNHKGIYLIAKKPRGITALASADPSDADILYIGMTTQSLRSRLRKLVAAVSTARKHSGGRRIANLFGPYPTGNVWKKDALYISYSAPYGKAPRDKTPDHFEEMGVICYLEYHLLGAFFERHGFTPKCNGKRRGEVRKISKAV
jgi:hypothetical protein